MQVTGSGFASISAGRWYTCALLQSGTAQCWGDNEHGQLGNGSFTEPETPTAVQGGLVFRALVTGMRTTCALTQAGAVYCWGGRGIGELGDGTTAFKLTPTRVPGATFSSIETNIYFSCGLSSGAVRCWGLNDYGQLGNGTTTNAVTPTVITGVGTLNAEVTVGSSHACVRTNAGALHCWGNNTSGQLGDGASTNRTTPVLVTGGQTYRSVSAGSGHTCAVNTAGQIFCWGSNSSGQLGTGNTTGRNVPTAVAGVAGITFAEVVAANFHTCARSTAGAVYCWGLNDNYQIGDGTLTTRTLPVLINVGTTVASVTANRTQTCARASNGSAYCWGTNNLGELGTGVPVQGVEPRPRAVLGGLTFASLCAGASITCGVTTSGAGYVEWPVQAGRAGPTALSETRDTVAQQRVIQ
ncbi:MAG: RCC1 domain-containing protein [Longimicrobiales bacterium]